MSGCPEHIQGFIEISNVWRFDHDNSSSLVFKKMTDIDQMIKFGIVMEI